MTTAAIPNELSVPAITEERMAWLALTLTPHLGLRRTLRAFERCGSAAKVLERGLTDLEALEFPVEVCSLSPMATHGCRSATRCTHQNRRPASHLYR